MPVNDDLGTRMKEYYETIPKTRLMRRTPVAIRIDGRAFHTFTRGFAKPFDEVLINAMQKTMKYLCQNIQGCVFGYHQSDEITLILLDYQTLDTDAWFGYEVQKMCSISASMATMAFSRFFAEEVEEAVIDDNSKLFATYCDAIKQGAMFDARVFNIPKEEVVNLIFWRQLDARRNSVQMMGQAYFSHKELQNKTCEMIKEMLLEQKDTDWDLLPACKRHGSSCMKVQTAPGRFEWYIHRDMPMLKGGARIYLERLIHINE